MTPRRGATWLLPALFLLQVPGCLSLSCPRHVTGTVGGSLSVQCRYKKEYTDHNKFWCQDPCLISLGSKIVETTESEREVRRGRVSIEDHPANLTFTVTLESLTEGDEGKYRCGIRTPWREKLIDLTFEVVVSVSPGGNPETPLKTPPSGKERKDDHVALSTHPEDRHKNPGPSKHLWTSKHPGSSLLPANHHRAECDQPGDA
ncbi:protein CD300H-like isoform X2 [Eptesicus fuscus]|uniref:protein CD300H-like isoform X2 n=1 Tax=Eptesicus fuscus TaxID=29078 RepID=UPI002403E788|nr:protein CD300H-like isoform X2 [Eptesicus fuscus]